MRRITIFLAGVVFMFGCAVTKSEKRPSNFEICDTGLLAILLQDSLTEAEPLAGAGGYFYVNVAGDCWRSLQLAVGNSDWTKRFKAIEISPEIGNDFKRVSETRSVAILIEAESVEPKRLSLLVSLYVGDSGIQYYRYELTGGAGKWKIEKRTMLGAT